MREIHTLRMQVEELRLQIKRDQALADHRHKVIAGWIGPEIGPSMETDIPDDVRKILGI